jgi:hypothetical protein
LVTLSIKVGIMDDKNLAINNFGRDTNGFDFIETLG